MGFAATAGATGIAAYNGVFNPQTPPAQIATVPATPADPTKPAIVTETPKAETPATTEVAKVEPAAPATTEVAKVDPAAPATTEVAKVDPAAPATTDIAKVDPAAPAVKMDATVVAPTAAAVMAPLFDVLRVQADGSVIIAGKADMDSHVEVVSGADVLGSTKTEPNGDFAIILTETLKPGDYQLVLRSTMPDGRVATSIQTATVSIPEKLTGPVLALVEEPGKPSRIITAPEKPVEVAAATPAAERPAASATATTEIAKPADTAAAPAVEVGIEAVEIEGDKIFIAGKAKGATTVRLFANDVLLGDTKAGEGDRFLAELVHAMPVGDYIIRAEGLAADGVTVVAKASVPFQRVAGDNMSASTAPADPAKPADTAAATTPAAATPATPAVVAEVKKAVIIHRGDTLWQISRRVYGHGVRYSTIYLANKDAVEDPNRIYPGQVMTVPAKTTEGEDADAAAIEKLNAATKG